jgi:glycine/D-amino acid oxidase-like deaminating enzyme
VVVVERDFISAGASSRNAGFACFGSPSEIIDDAIQWGWDAAMETVQWRIQGLQLLKEYIPFSQIDGEQKDGFEIFQSQDAQILELVRDHWSTLSENCERFLGHFPFSFTDDQWGFRDIQGVIRIKGEGVLHPAKMLDAWQDRCRMIGVDLVYGLTIDRVLLKEGSVQIRDLLVSPQHLIICTNGLTSSLIDGLDVIPARNQVLVTNAILDKPWNGSFHQRKGYVYFRNIGKQVLIGGARDLFKSQEYTDSLEVNEQIIEHLRDHLAGILGHANFTIAHQWSGIMGLGNGKGPIIKKIGSKSYVAVRMGGMGVAIGTAVGKRLSEIIE